MLSKKIIFFICSLLVLLLTACSDNPYEKKAKQRAQLAETTDNAIVIGISWSSDKESFIQGAELALKKINEDGGLLNRSVEIIVDTDETKLEDPTLSKEAYKKTVLNTATTFANNSDVIAVIGHAHSDAALLASVVYQSTGVLFLAPSATNQKLTAHQFSYVFRTIPDNYKMGTQIADYISEQGYKKIALLNDRGTYGTELADTVESYITEKHGAEIIFSRSFFKSSIDLTSLIIDLKKSGKFEIIFVASDSHFIEVIYKKSRNMDIRIPFVGGETLDTPSFLNKVELWENSTDIKKSIIPTMFNPLLPENQEFIELFKKEYGEDNPPSHLAAMGYDNMMLLAHAIKRSQSTVPARIADTLRYMQPCEGLAGKYEFDESGDLIDRAFFFKELYLGKYQYTQLKEVNERFKKSSEICNKIDHDNDGIPNNLDACANNTAEEIAKGIELTGLKRGCPVDSDKDKIADYIDACFENTAEEISKGVDKQGCPLDSDGDKTEDYKDACPNNPELTEFVSGKNCVEDRDGDEITDDIDQCPDNSKQEIAQGVNKTGEQQGCPVDTDFDTLADYMDSCPENTTEEISQGVDDKGCPADNDTDSILDYQDECLKTPAKAQINKHGCGIVETNIMLQSSDLYFKQGQIILTAQGKSYLESFIGQIQIDLLKQLKIVVHTDNKGDSEKNQTLSLEQATTIKDYLIERGIDGEKIISEGKVDSIAIVDNKTNEDDDQNHRLEIILMQFKKKEPSLAKQENRLDLETN